MTEKLLLGRYRESEVLSESGKLLVADKSRVVVLTALM